MSNLNLPKMTFGNLAALVGKPGHSVKLAYATYAYLARDRSYVEVIHHNTKIGELRDNGDVFVTNAGYTSSTTRNRIHTILKHNTNFGVCQRNHIQCLIVNLTGTRQYMTGFESAFITNAGELTIFNRNSVVAG